MSNNIEVEVHFVRILLVSTRPDVLRVEFGSFLSAFLGHIFAFAL